MRIFHTMVFLARRLLNRQATVVGVFGAEGREIGQVQPTSQYKGTPRWRQRLTGDEGWGFQLALSKDEAIKLVPLAGQARGRKQPHGERGVRRLLPAVGSG